MAAYALDGFERIQELTNNALVLDQASCSAESVRENLETIDTIADTLIVEILESELRRRSHDSV